MNRVADYELPGSMSADARDYLFTVPALSWGEKLTAVADAALIARTPARVPTERPHAALELAADIASLQGQA